MHTVEPTLRILFPVQTWPGLLENFTKRIFLVKITKNGQKRPKITHNCGHTIVIFVHKCFMKDFMSVPLKRKSSKNQTEQSECLFVFCLTKQVFELLMEIRMCKYQVLSRQMGGQYLLINFYFLHRVFPVGHGDKRKLIVRGLYGLFT